MIANSRWLLAAFLAAGLTVAVAAGLLALAGSDDGGPTMVAQATATPRAASPTTPAPLSPSAKTVTTPTPSLSPTPEPSPSANATTAPGATLSPGDLLNAEYLIPDMNVRVELQDGVYYWVRQPGQMEKDNPAPLEPQENWLSRLDPDLIASGDLDGDGAEDAAVIIRSQFGGTGIFVALAVLKNDGGSPVHLATDVLGDRVVVNAIAIERGEIIVDLLTFAPPSSPQWAGQCCPTELAVLRYRLEGTQLVQVP
jgi:hypothetical protein